MYLESESDGDGVWEVGEHGAFRVVYSKKLEQFVLTLRGNWRVKSSTFESDNDETGLDPDGGENTRLVVWKD